MLDLINQARRNAGLSPVELGDNIAAQLHAESSLENCTSSHWGNDGLKPYMRYSLAGGYQSNGENGSGLDYCIKSGERYKALDPIEDEVREAMAGWMSSPGHRRNILDGQHQKVNIGLAWDRYNFFAYQHFEGDYVEYTAMPSIKDGILSIEGRTKHGARFSRPRDLGVMVFYDPPPYPLARGQLSRTYCYDSGLLVASLRRPLSGGEYWPTDSFTHAGSRCPDPYKVPKSAKPPRSPREAHAHWEEAYLASSLLLPGTITVPWITATRWRAIGDQFAVKANLRSIVKENGDGVYSIMVWNKARGNDMVISEYSIFYGTEPPSGYSRPEGTHP